MLPRTLPYLDHLAIIMMLLINGIGVSILFFSSRYMSGDSKYKSFFIKTILLLVTLNVMVSSDNIITFLITWALSNTLLVTLIIHKRCWKAAYNSGLIAARNFCFGFISLTLGFFLLYQISGETSISKIVNSNISVHQLFVPSIFILIAAMTQSAILPFHRWLLSSLNAPTPVSAIMHAGLVNGGGFLLARFAPLWTHSPFFLNTIFCIGIITAFYGTLWKLMQPDVKKMLACSTVGQMGFMMAECGLGLFSAAITHLCWHGLFKAYLFLNSPSASQEKRVSTLHSASWTSIALSFFGGISGSTAFILVGGHNFSLHNSTAVFVTIAFITSYQLSLTMMETFSIKKVLLMFLVTIALGGSYGLNFRGMEIFLEPLNLFEPQPLNIFYLCGIFILIGSWIYRLYLLHNADKKQPTKWYLKNYVSMINASQPYPSTVTSYRNDYQYQ